MFASFYGVITTVNDHDAVRAVLTSVDDVTRKVIVVVLFAVQLCVANFDDVTRKAIVVV